MKCFVYKGKMYECAGEPNNGYVNGMIADPFAPMCPDTYVSAPVKDVMFIVVDTTPDKNKEKIHLFKDIVDSGSYKEHDGMIIDVFTASTVVQIYNLLNDENKQNLLSHSIRDICLFSLKLANKTQNGQDTQ